MKRWLPSEQRSEREERLLKLAGRSRKLFVFLRAQRRRLFDADFQVELESMYRDSGQGEEAQPPALMCMALLLQGYLQTSDAESVRLSATDLCWRVVLGTLEERDDKPAFSQGGLQQFRERLIRHDMDVRLLERTIELAKLTREFDWKKLPKTLRLAVDSRPLEGAGRVEDTINLLGHAGRKIAECAAALLEIDMHAVCSTAKAPLLLASSVKAGLDIDWSDSDDKEDALNRLCQQLERLTTWIDKQQIVAAAGAPLHRYRTALTQVQQQDLENVVGGGVRRRQGVAQERRISIEDEDMRHGRKSKSKTINGYKQHIGTHVDTGLVLACAVTPANRPEEEAGASLAADLGRLGFVAHELQIDRAYLHSELTTQVRALDGDVICRPWSGANSTGLFGKRDFKIDSRASTITCPAGQTEPFVAGESVEFDPDVCGACPLRAQCTNAAAGRGRSVHMGSDEALQKKLRRLVGTSSGRRRLRERTAVEHSLAHVSNRQGSRARYRGIRKNTFDLRRLATVQNLETIARVAARAA